jgi:hypothetical protein
MRASFWGGGGAGKELETYMSRAGMREARPNRHKTLRKDPINVEDVRLVKRLCVCVCVCVSSDILSISSAESFPKNKPRGGSRWGALTIQKAWKEIF